MASTKLDDILRGALRVGASDVHLKAGSPPALRVDGRIVFVKGAPALSQSEIKAMAFSIMNDWQRKRFEDNTEVDMAYSIPGLTRWRVNIYIQRGLIAMALRAIPHEILGFKELNLAPIMEKISQEERGLILVTGTTSSGKSTTLAAMIDYMNTNRSAHIITIEDPLEFVHRDKKSFISQREVGIDTQSFANSIRAAMRQDPDIILVGEMRDLETIETALLAAETGHLVLSTLHTLDAQETINRILTIFPANQHNQVRYQLAQVLKAVISQRLVPRADGRGRVPAQEILIVTSRIRELISNPAKTMEIRTAIEEGHLHYGMQTFDQCLFSLYNRGLITYDEALRQATNPGDLDLRLRGVRTGTADNAEVRGVRGSMANPEVEDDEIEIDIDRFR